MDLVTLHERCAMRHGRKEQLIRARGDKINLEKICETFNDFCYINNLFDKSR